MKCNGFNLTEGEVTVITFNNPRVNIFSSEVLRDLAGALSAMSPAMAPDREKEKVKAVVFAAEGNTFVAGADIKEMAAFTPASANDYARLFHETLNLVEAFPVPVIAAVNGYALGGGCELILACDLVIAGESAVFSQPEIELGIIPGAGGTQRLPRRVGVLRAKELILTGRRVMADEAVRIGLINKVVPDDALMDEVMELAGLIASRPLQCVKAIKSLVGDGGSMEQEITKWCELFTYEDQKELMKKFIEKR